MKKSNNIFAVAERAGVSAMTVTRAFSGGAVAKATRDRVFAAAGELDYHPNLMARALRGAATGTIAVIIARPHLIEQDYSKQLILRLLAEFGRRDRAAFCHIQPADAADAYAKVAEFISRGVEHLVFIGMPVGCEKILPLLKRTGVGAVFNRKSAPRCVVSDTRAGAGELFKHLLDRCGKNFRFANFAGDDAEPASERVLALTDALGLPAPEAAEPFIVPIYAKPPEYLDYYERTFAIGRETMEQLLSRHPGLGGVAFPNDAIALGAVSLLMESKYKKFRRLVVTGYDNERTLRHFPYPVSSAAMDCEKMAAALAENALGDEPCQIFVKPEVFIRDFQ